MVPANAYYEDFILSEREYNERRYILQFVTAERIHAYAEASILIGRRNFGTFFHRFFANRAITQDDFDDAVRDITILRTRELAALSQHEDAVRRRDQARALARRPERLRRWGIYGGLTFIGAGLVTGAVFGVKWLLEHTGGTSPPSTSASDQMLLLSDDDTFLLDYSQKMLSDFDLYFQTELPLVLLPVCITETSGWS